MSSKRRNRSRWESSRSTAVSPPPLAALPPAASAAGIAASLVTARNGSPNLGVAAAPVLSDFSLDYRYELSLPAQMLIGREPWSYRLSDYSDTYSHSHLDPTGYGLQGHYKGSLFADSPVMLEEYSKRDKWHALEPSQHNSSLYGLSSRSGDAGHALQLAHIAELRSEGVYSGSSIDAKVNQLGSASAIGGREDALKESEGPVTTERLKDSKLYCSVCDRAFPTAPQKEAHLRSHVLCEEEHCQFEATAKKVKEHMLKEHGKHLKKIVRARQDSDKEAERTQPKDNQINVPGKADRKRASELPEQTSGGLLTPIEDDPDDERNDAGLVERKSVKQRNYRVPGRYNPY